MPLPLLAQHTIWYVVEMDPWLRLLIPAATGGDDVQMGVVLPITAMRLDDDDVAAFEGSATDPTEDIIQAPRNRSPYENRNHAAACDCISQAGRRNGAASPCRAASWAAVRSSSTLRFWCFNVATTVIILSTKREPASLWVPKLPLRHCTPGRIARSAVLFVGSTPATCTKVHNAWRRFRISRHVPAVLAMPHWLPASNSRSTSRRRGVI